MFNIIKGVILSGRYELRDIISKIDTVWLQSDISETEKTELVELAREHCTPEMGYASLQSQLDELKERVKALEDANKADTDGETSTEGETPAEDEFPEYRQPTGAHDAYYAGDKITYDGKHYICIAPEGYGVAYSPDDLPSMWELVEVE